MSNNDNKLSTEELLNKAEDLLMKWIDKILPGQKFNGEIVLRRVREKGGESWSARCQISTIQIPEPYVLSGTGTGEKKTREEALVKLCNNLAEQYLWAFETTVSSNYSFGGHVKGEKFYL